uniref:SFRICE_028655 n=1 Tax=Spodoptera frugiperda TaxID=7108 RepID=A0A2H1WLS9_SPOFR
MGVIEPPITLLTQRKRCFTSVFYDAVILLRSSRPIRVWLSHTYFPFIVILHLVAKFRVPE